MRWSVMENSLSRRYWSGALKGFSHFSRHSRLSLESSFSIATFLAELVRLQVDILVTGFTAATLAARDVTDTIPIVFASMSDPVERGLVASLNQPGGNITGVANINTETLA